MPELSHVEFLFAVLKHTPSKSNIPALSKALNLNPSAASMRMTRLKKKLASGDNNKITSKDADFLETVVRCSDGKTDIKGLAQECGLKMGAVSMRLTRLRKKWEAEGKGVVKAGGRKPRGGEEVPVPTGERVIKVEGAEITVEFDDEQY